MKRNDRKVKVRMVFLPAGEMKGVCEGLNSAAVNRGLGCSRGAALYHQSQWRAMRKDAGRRRRRRLEEVERCGTGMGRTSI